ncbi:hypothetical protein ACWEEK_29845 [Micromonospora aurantiaca (nom. illeg.)]|uniref:hypothetical protein n=1 Tax=Micromonospora sp. BL1 TaxID=2478709 RepID=UPI000EF5F479|nr:hypothetical protein [Micromonospora sp. BL1]
METLTRAGARVARCIAEQRYALAFDLKASAAADVARLRAADAEPDLLVEAVNELMRATALVAEARAALDEVTTVHRIAWRDARP